MTGRYIVKNDQRVLVVDDYLNEQELRFAQGTDGELDPRYALELAIDLMSNTVRAPERAPEKPRPFASWLNWRRMTPAGGAC